MTNDPSSLAVPIIYNVSYVGENIMSGFVDATQPITTFVLTSLNDSDVNVTVTAMNVFGSGPASNVSNASMSNISELHIMRTYVHMYILHKEITQQTAVMYCSNGLSI